jgi:bacillithiol biosynthesis deacetylase BshB1
VSLDALFFGAHPDDVELTSGGLAALLASHGHRVGIVDLTRGESATRGTPEERAREAAAAAAALGVAQRHSLGLPDTGLDARDRAQLAAVVACLRAERPALVVAPDRHDAHPDHIEGSALITRACYLAGLARFDAPGERFRPRRVLYALHRAAQAPHLVVDVTPVWERRSAALAAHASQLAAAGPATYLTHPDFLPEVEARARAFGALIGVRHGEGYRVRGPLAIEDARALLSPSPGGPS